jgi:hypothetical protein
MCGERYQLNVPTLAFLRLQTGKRIPITVPTGAILSVVNDRQSRSLVEVEWDSEIILMFRTDLRERGTAID